jgi:hypothetical protein
MTEHMNSLLRLPDAGHHSSRLYLLFDYFTHCSSGDKSSPDFLDQNGCLNVPELYVPFFDNGEKVEFVSEVLSGYVFIVEQVLILHHVS